MKAKPKRVKTPAPKTPKSRKKLQFEDFVKGALVSAAVVCAVVLGIGGFYIVRSILSGNYAPSVLSALDETPEPKAAPESGEPPVGQADQASPAAPAEFPPPDDLSGADGLPDNSGLEQAIRDLETAGADTAANAAAGVSPATEVDPAVGPNPAAQPAAPSGRPAAANAATPNVVTPAAPAERKGILVLVIDDAGNNLQNLDPFLKFPGPITIAVLPGLANSVEAARRVRAAGKELFLHQPMEPLNGQDPGPGAIKTGMSPVEVKEILLKNLTEIGPVAGFNNHEGSRATSDPAIMRPVLEISRDGALYFLDSRTTADTAAPQIARELGIKIVQRNFFLDNEQDSEAILAVLEAGCRWAEKNGTAILIGHAWSPRLAAILLETHPQIIKRGLIFASIGTLLSRGK